MAVVVNLVRYRKQREWAMRRAQSAESRRRAGRPAPDRSGERRDDSGGGGDLPEGEAALPEPQSGDGA